MSGEIVIASSLFPAAAVAAPLLGVVVVGSLVYQAVEAHRIRCREQLFLNSLNQSSHWP